MKIGSKGDKLFLLKSKHKKLIPISDIKFVKYEGSWVELAWESNPQIQDIYIDHNKPFNQNPLYIYVKI